MSKQPLLLLSALVLAGLALGTAPAPAAIVTLAPNGADARAFATSQGGWTSSVDLGGLVCIPNITCPTATPSFQATDGAGGPGDGHLRVQFGTLLGILSTTTVSWTSPAFTAPPATDQAALSVAARTAISPLLSAGATMALDAELVDVATPADTLLLASVPFTVATPTYDALDIPVPSAALVPGLSYRVRLSTHLTTNVSAIANGSLDYDDVVLELTDVQPPTGLTATVPATGALRVEGQVDPHGVPTDVVVDYGPTAGYGSSTAPAAVDGSGPQPFTIPLPGLSSATTYHYRVRATSADGTSTTGDGTFATAAAPLDPTPDPAPPAGPTPDPTPGADPAPTAPAGPSDGSGTGSLDALTLALTDPGRFGTLLARCYGAPDVVLADARVRSGKASISGLTRFAPGTAIAILDERGRKVARATVDVRGRFRTAAALPSAKRRPHTLYTAVAGSSRSSRLRLLRDNTLRSVHRTAGILTIRGHVKVARLGSRVRFAVLGGHGAAACRHRGTRLRLAAQPRFDRRTGAYLLKVRAPGGSGPLAVSTRAAGRTISHSAYALR